MSRGEGRDTGVLLPVIEAEPGPSFSRKCPLAHRLGWHLLPFLPHDNSFWSVLNHCILNKTFGNVCTSMLKSNAWTLNAVAYNWNKKLAGMI